MKTATDFAKRLWETSREAPMEIPRLTYSDCLYLTADLYTLHEKELETLCEKIKQLKENNEFMTEEIRRTQEMKRAFEQRKLGGKNANASTE